MTKTKTCPLRLPRSLKKAVEQQSKEDAEAAWNQEIARRIADLDSGKAKTIPWEEVRERISSILPES